MSTVKDRCSKVACLLRKDIFFRWKYSFYLLKSYSSHQAHGASHNVYHSALQERSLSSYTETSFETGLTKLDSVQT